MTATDLRVPCTILWSDGLNVHADEVTGFATSTPGVLVVERSQGWSVSHRRSGGCIALAENPEQAQAFAAALSELGDWDIPAIDLRPRRAAVVALRERLGVREGDGPDAYQTSPEAVSA